MDSCQWRRFREDLMEGLRKMIMISPGKGKGSMRKDSSGMCRGVKNHVMVFEFS